MCDKKVTSNIPKEDENSGIIKKSSTMSVPLPGRNSVCI